MHDTICLCLADGHLLGVGLSRVIELQRALFASWAGRRVICLGNYAEDDDYPPSIQGYVEQELRRMHDIDAESDGDIEPDSDGNNEPNSDGDSEEDEDEDERPKFYELVQEHYETFKNGDESWYQPDDSRRTHMLNSDEKKAYLFLSEPKYPSPDQQILCNLSKGEYVRNQALQDSELTAEIDDEYYYDENWSSRLPMVSVELAHALLSRICWSTYSDELDIHRGPWAGDKLEVTTMDKVTSDVEWRDISEEVLDILREIWATEDTYM